MSSLMLVVCRMMARVTADISYTQRYLDDVYLHVELVS